MKIIRAFDPRGCGVGTDRAATGNDERDRQLVLDDPFPGETSLSVALKVPSHMLQVSVWVVRDDLPRAEWPQDGPVYTHGEVRILTKVSQDALEWVNPVKEIFNAKVIAAHSAAKRSPMSYRRQQNVDV